ncbi:unnamed protein product [Camellia sinensis]
MTYNYNNHFLTMQKLKILTAIFILRANKTWDTHQGGAATSSWMSAAIPYGDRGGENTSNAVAIGSSRRRSAGATARGGLWWSSGGGEESSAVERWKR